MSDDSDTQTEDFLEHFGVKGMKWGVRREAKLQRLERVGRGEGSLGENARTYLTNLSPNDIARNGGLRKASEAKAEYMRGRKERILSGKATVKDLLGNYGDLRLSELVVPPGLAGKLKTR